MMYARIMKNEMKRKLGAMVVVFFFILLSSLFVAGGTSLIVALESSLERLFDRAAVPHFVQMHAGELDVQQIEGWSVNSELVESHQVVEMITVDSAALYLGGGETAERESVMDISFVTQNRRFDYLLDSDNRIAEVGPGEIGIPVYYSVEKDLGIGDAVALRQGEFERRYTVAAVVKDAQMNPPIVHSKRFLVSETDYSEIATAFTEREYLIEFRLADPERTDAFSRAYEAAGLPQRGPAVDHQLFALLNGLSDGIVAVVVIIVSLLLLVIAMLCLRFTILASIEEDYREIGVMKAIGMPKGKIRRLYLSKYLLLGGAGAVIGYLASLPLSNLLTRNISVYVGYVAPSFEERLFSIGSSAGILLLTLLAAILVLRRFGRISAVEALHAGARTDEPRPGRGLRITRGKPFNINMFLGIRDALHRLKLFGLLVFIFFFAAAITLVPLHFLSTMSSPEFITYMGVGRSDIRVDLRQAEGVEKRFDDVVSRVAADPEVAEHAPRVTSQFTLLRETKETKETGETGETETIDVETGDFSLFPLDYLRGRAPEDDTEIALSYLNSKELGKEIGDRISLRSNGTRRSVEVVGIYQDVTDGGRTAKGAFSPNSEAILALTISLDLEPGVSVDKKVAEYADAFHPARVTGLESYLEQTLGGTIGQLRQVVLGAVLVGAVIALLITSLFLRMLISKDKGRIAIMKSLGFSVQAIRIQYLTTALLLLLLGIGLGTLFANTLGQEIVGFLWGFMGAARIEFVIDPLRAYLLLPMLLMATVATTTIVAIRGIKNHTVAATIAE